MAPQKFQNCIEACLDCATACRKCAAECREMAGFQKLIPSRFVSDSSGSTSASLISSWLKLTSTTSSFGIFFQLRKGSPRNVKRTPRSAKAIKAASIKDQLMNSMFAK
ncbi:four-helix bundle copper-binding protein [Stieleria sedimenti]|uniref:four-helix bundle copper-binding protein n=1 Tax=Stieleria sedimenti TaxID=2976331 RepID=UPI00389AA1B9